MAPHLQVLLSACNLLPSFHPSIDHMLAWIEVESQTITANHPVDSPTAIVYMPLDEQFSTSRKKDWEEWGYKVKSDHTINKFSVSITSQLSPMWCEAHHIARKLNWVQLSHNVAASALSWAITISMTSAAGHGTSHNVLPQLRHPWGSGFRSFDPHG